MNLIFFISEKAFKSKTVLNTGFHSDKKFNKGNNIEKLQEKIATLIVDYLVYFVEFLMISFNKKTCIKFQLVLN